VIEELVRSYCEMWDTDDDAARQVLLEEIWAEDGLYCDPTAIARGRAGFHAHICEFRQQFAGHGLRMTSGVDEHHGWFRFAWALQRDGGDVVLEGFDVGSLAPDGRIERIVGFFGPFPGAG
jgi:hypothetical protein